MKKLVLSAFCGRIYDAELSKSNPNLMTTRRIDRTEEVKNVFLQWLDNQLEKGSKGIVIDYGDRELTWKVKEPENEI